MLSLRSNAEVQVHLVQFVQCKLLSRLEHHEKRARLSDCYPFQQVHWPRSGFSGQQGTALWIPLRRAHNGLEKAGENIFCNEPAANVGFAAFSPGRVRKNHGTRPRKYTWIKHHHCRTCDSYTDELGQNHTKITWIWPSGPLLNKGWANLAAANGLPGRRLWPWLQAVPRLCRAGCHGSHDWGCCHWAYLSEFVAEPQSTCYPHTTFETATFETCFLTW